MKKIGIALALLSFLGCTTSKSLVSYLDDKDTHPTFHREIKFSKSNPVAPGYTITVLERCSRQESSRLRGDALGPDSDGPVEFRHSVWSRERNLLSKGRLGASKDREKFRESQGVVECEPLKVDFASTTGWATTLARPAIIAGGMVGGAYFMGRGLVEPSAQPEPPKIYSMVKTEPPSSPKAGKTGRGTQDPRPQPQLSSTCVGNCAETSMVVLDPDSSPSSKPSPETRTEAGGVTVPEETGLQLAQNPTEGVSSPSAFQNPVWENYIRPQVPGTNLVEASFLPGESPSGSETSSHCEGACGSTPANGEALSSAERKEGEPAEKSRMTPDRAPSKPVRVAQGPEIPPTSPESFSRTAWDEPKKSALLERGVQDVAQLSGTDSTASFGAERLKKPVRVAQGPEIPPTSPESFSRTAWNRPERSVLRERGMWDLAELPEQSASPEAPRGEKKNSRRAKDSPTRDENPLILAAQAKPDENSAGSSTPVPSGPAPAPEASNPMVPDSFRNPVWNRESGTRVLSQGEVELARLPSGNPASAGRNSPCLENCSKPDSLSDGFEPVQEPDSREDLVMAQMGLPPIFEGEIQEEEIRRGIIEEDVPDEEVREEAPEDRPVPSSVDPEPVSSPKEDEPEVTENRNPAPRDTRPEVWGRPSEPVEVARIPPIGPITEPGHRRTIIWDDSSEQSETPEEKPSSSPPAPDPGEGTDPSGEKGSSSQKGKPSSRLELPQGQWTVARGDTLLGIAQKMDVFHIEPVRIAVALWMDNPGVFVRGNMNGIRAGAVLNLRNLSARLKEVDLRTALRTLRKQKMAWERGLVSPPVTVAQTSPSRPQTLTVSRGDSLLKIAAGLDFVRAEKERVAVALWMDNRDRFIRGNLNGLQAGKKLDLRHLKQRVNELDLKTARWILSVHWKEWNESGKGTSFFARSVSPTPPKREVPLPPSSSGERDRKTTGSSGAGKPEQHLVSRMGMETGSFPVPDRNSTAGPDRQAVNKKQVRVRPGQTLLGIARNLDTVSGNPARVAVAIWMDNKEKFIRGNLHGLLPGKSLNIRKLPHRLKSIDLKTARRILKAQWQRWQGGERKNPQKGKPNYFSATPVSSSGTIGISSSPR